MARRRVIVDENHSENMNCVSTPTVYHAAIVIFLEFFAFGLLTTPMISVLDEAFPKHTFLMNGIIQGVKGFLSFLSAPLIGALSDGIGRKPFLLLTVTFTCSPIPLMKISHWWYFTMISISGIFAVTFSVVLAYVADITTEEDRSWGYGLVSATFAASLVTSPAIGAYLGRVFTEDLVIALATAIAFLDILFIMACVPESLPDKIRSSSHSCSPTNRGNSNGGSNCGKLSWDAIDPFAALRKISNDRLVLIICITTLFSYLPEAGQYSCFFVYLRLVMGFSEESVAMFIAVGGILACISQTIVLSVLNSYVGPKRAIIVGLVFEAIQLTFYGFATHHAMLWIAGCIAAVGSITYPALSAFVSKHAAVDQQGVAQGLVTGIRGLCGGLGPALFGLIFYLFRVDLNTQTSGVPSPDASDGAKYLEILQDQTLPGAPFAFGAVLVLLAIFVALFIPENPKSTLVSLSPSSSTPSGPVPAIHRAISVPFHGNLLRNLDRDSLLSTDGSACYDDQLSLLSESKFRAKHSREPSKDHFPPDMEPNFLDRWIFGWSDNRRRPYTKRTGRLFPHPTVSFARAQFVEPIRRLLTGFSSSNKSTSSAVEVHAPNFLDAPVQSFRFDWVPCDSPDTRESDYDTEAADLSNYRSHNLKQFIASATSTGAPSNGRLLEAPHRCLNPSVTTGHITSNKTGLLSFENYTFDSPEDVAKPQIGASDNFRRSTSAS